VIILGVFYNREFRTGGHTRYIELMEGLARRGHHVHVLLNSFLQYNPLFFEPLRRPVVYRRNGFPPASWIFAAAAEKEVAGLLHRIGSSDAVVVFGETHLAAGKVLARALKTILVYAHRSNGVRAALAFSAEARRMPVRRLSLLPRMAKAMLDERRIARLADLVVFQSAYDLEDFRSRVAIPRERVVIVPGDITGPRFRAECAEVNSSTAVKRIAFMGTLGQRKGVDYLVEAARILRSRGHGDLRFEICGPGERLKELGALLSRQGLSEMVSLRGKVADPFPVLKDTDLLVVPSLFDSYPNSVLEALHVGTPVIGSRVGGIPDQLRYDDLLFPPMDAQAIADRIERCVCEPAFYQSLRQLCSERRASFVFDWPEAWERAIGTRVAELKKAKDDQARRS
jgi:glycosyltransferase involved in cell wall biosynthesis